MDLRTPIVPKGQLHANFRVLNDSGHFDDEWQTLQSWAEGFIDRDGKFVKEFQTTFNSSFWELYLHATFRELGFSFDFSHSRPDFVMSHLNGQPLIAEAVVASNAEGYCPEWKRSFDQFDDINTEEIVHIATIRLANAIWSKYMKFKGSYSKLNHIGGKPFVICVAPFEQPMFFIQNDNALRRVLYGFDQPLWIPGPNGTRVPVGQSSMPEVIKDNGSSVPLGFFTSPMMPEISGVIFSNTATTTKVRALTKNGKIATVFHAVRYNDKGTEPHMIAAQRPGYNESLLDGLHVCINPFAIHPLDASMFTDREIAIHQFDIETQEYLPIAPDGFLYQHGCVTVTSGLGVKEMEEIAADEFKRPVLQMRQEKELFPVAGHVHVFVDNHLAHYNGWTICVARDSVDGDWGAQATTGRYGTLASYQQADKSNLVLGQKFYSTKEEAFDEAIKAVDRHLNQPAIEAARAKCAMSRKSDMKRQRRKNHKEERKRKKQARRR